MVGIGRLNKLGRVLSPEEISYYKWANRQWQDIREQAPPSFSDLRISQNFTGADSIEVTPKPKSEFIKKKAYVVWYSHNYTQRREISVEWWEETGKEVSDAQIDSWMDSAINEFVQIPLGQMEYWISAERGQGLNAYYTKRALVGSGIYVDVKAEDIPNYGLIEARYTYPSGSKNTKLLR